jgi:hypothetical protein
VRLEGWDVGQSFGVAVGELVAVGVAEGGPFQTVDRLLGGLVGVVNGEHDGVSAYFQDGSG